jgi:hypothetical protein
MPGFNIRSFSQSLRPQCTIIAIGRGKPGAGIGRGGHKGPPSYRRAHIQERDIAELSTEFGTRINKWILINSKNPLYLIYGPGEHFNIVFLSF